MAITVDKVIAVAQAEIGYLEKKSPKDLDDKTKNAGSENYTKYGRDLKELIGKPYQNGVAWCDMFFDWCMLQVCMKELGKEKGIAKAKELLGGWSAYTPTSAKYYKNMDRWTLDKPVVGSQIFFKNSTRICHTGIVYKVDKNYVYTIEGNTSSASGVVANGGCVRAKSYTLGYSKIAGYGLPAYEKEKTEKVDEFDQLVIELKNAINSEFRKLKSKISVNAKVDTELINATPTLNIKTRAKYPNTVKVFQKLLNYHGYKVAIDGDFYTATEKKLKEFQKIEVAMAKPDGEATAKMGTWKKILKR